MPARAACTRGVESSRARARSYDFLASAVRPSIIWYWPMTIQRLRSPGYSSASSWSGSIAAMLGAVVGSLKVLAWISM